MEELTPMQTSDNEALQHAKTTMPTEQTSETVEAADATALTAESTIEQTAQPVENYQPDVEDNEKTSEAKIEESQPVETTVEAEKIEPQTDEAQPEEEVVDATATEDATSASVDERKEPEPEVDYSAMGREQLLEAFAELMEHEVQTISHRVVALRTRFFDLTKQVEKEAFDKFIAEGGIKEQYQAASDELTEKFRSLQNQYKKRRQQYKEAQEAQKQRNLEAKQQILEDLRQLIDSNEETLKQLYDRFNEIQEKWKTIGEVSREYLNDLWQNYHLLVEKFFNKVNINKELRQLDLKRNLEEKIQLCEKAEELIVEDSMLKAFKSLNLLRDRWREIGPVPAEQNDEIWQRFNNAANRIEERRKEYYEQRKEEMDKNLLAKQALVDKAREITARHPESAAQWNATTTELDELLKLWKSIGPVPREVNETIWKEFKGMIDEFYAAKKAHFNSVRDEQTENYNRKIDLCLKAEAIAKRDDWKRATEEILALQEEWKAIGPVSRKFSEKIWHRFRGACDEFFAKKGDYFKGMRASEGENLKKKEEILAQLKAYQFGTDKEENLRVIKDFQRQWMEIGHVPMSEKDRLQREFRQIIDAHFEKLQINAREAAESAYRERVRNNSGDHRFATGERQQLVDKIEKLKSSIKLWENNLGFLANSRSADLLKEEFEKKMQSTRQQIALLEAKLKILLESDKNETAEQK